MVSPMGHPVSVLWSVPRSVSTSFERMISERGDHIVLDEPFSRAYYFGPDRHSHRYQESIPHSSVGEIVEQIEGAARDRPVFIKDMAYQARDVLSGGFLDAVQSTFLVRHPSAAVRSLARSWPDFTDEETGWAHLAIVADRLEEQGRPLIVVEAESLCARPDLVVADWCARTGLEHMPDALTWKPGMRPKWELWSDWHGSTSRTTGFASLQPVPPPPEEARLRAAYDDAMPVYERLRAHALQL